MTKKARLKKFTDWQRRVIDSGEVEFHEWFGADTDAGQVLARIARAGYLAPDVGRHGIDGFVVRDFYMDSCGRGRPGTHWFVRLGNGEVKNLKARATLTGARPVRISKTQKQSLFRDLAFDQIEEVRRGMTDEQEGWHVHHAGLHFVDLIDGFIAECCGGVEPEFVLVGTGHVAFAKTGLAQQWQTYHARHADLQLVPAEVNLRASQRRCRLLTDTEWR